MKVAQFNFGTGTTPVNGALVAWRKSATWQHNLASGTGMTPGQVALRLGIPAEEYIAIEQLEHWPSPTSNVARSLARMVGIPVNELFPYSIKVFAIREGNSNADAGVRWVDGAPTAKTSIQYEIGNDGSFVQQHAP